MAAASGTVSLASVVRDLKEYAQDIMKPEGSTAYEKAESKKIKEIAETAFRHLDKIMDDLAFAQLLRSIQDASGDPSATLRGHRIPPQIHPTPRSEVVEELFDTIRTFVFKELGELMQFDRVSSVFTQFLSPEAIPKAQGLTYEIARGEKNCIRRQIAAENDRKIVANIADEPFLKLFSAMPSTLKCLTHAYLPEYTKEDAIRISIANIYEIFRINPPEGVRKLIEFANAYKIPFKFIHEKFWYHTKEMNEITRELTFVDLRGFSELFPSTGLLMHLTTFLKKCTKAQEIFIFPLEIPYGEFLAFAGANLIDLKALPVLIQDALINALVPGANTTLIFAVMKDKDPAYTEQAKEKWERYHGTVLNELPPLLDVEV